MHLSSNPLVHLHFFSQCIVLSNIVSNGKAYLRKNSKRKQFGKTINFKAASDR